MLKSCIQTIVTSIILISTSLGFAMNTSSDEQSFIIYAHEFDEDLELHESSNLQASITEFKAKGGTLLRMEGNASPFQLKADDMVFPSCSGGNNRSQTLWGLLLPYDGIISLQLPHATRYGFDPYNGKVNWNRTHHIQKNDEFINWSGVFKSKKFGWEMFNDWLLKDEATADELSMMSEYYSTHYYCPDLAAGIRRVYITFAKNVHVHLHRLNQTNSTLENVVLLFYPIEDLIAAPLPEWETHPRSVKAYSELASILEKYLDFSQLKSTISQ